MRTSLERLAFHLSSAACGDPDGFSANDLSLMYAVTRDDRPAPRRRPLRDLLRADALGSDLIRGRRTA